MDPGDGLVVGDLCSVGVHWFRSLVGGVYFGRLALLLHLGGGSVRVVYMIKETWLIHQLVGNVVLRRVVFHGQPTGLAGHLGFQYLGDLVHDERGQ